MRLIKTILLPVTIGCFAVSIIVGTVCKLAPKAKEAFKGKKKSKKKSLFRKREPKGAHAK